MCNCSNYSGFDASLQRKDISGANRALMLEAGKILVNDRQGFVDMLNECGIAASLTMSDVELIERFSDEIDRNPKLMLGCSMLIAEHNADSSFDGDEYNRRVKQGYAVMRNYWADDIDDDDYSDADGGVIGAVAGAVGQVAQSGAQIATKAMEGSQKKKYGALDYATKSKEAQGALVQAALSQRQAQIDAEKSKRDQGSKTTRTLLIVGGVIVGLAVIGTIIYMARKGGKK